MRKPQSWPPKDCHNNNAEFCSWPGTFTSDGRYGVARMSEGHDNLLGNWVETKVSYIVFSVASHADIGEIEVSLRDSERSATIVLEGREYLLLLLNGTRLAVDELRD